MRADLFNKDVEAFRNTRRLAEFGQPKAQYNLGLMYANGVGVEQDFQLALHWYRQAAEQGFSPAQYILAGKYAAGQGVERDMQQALSWYLKASERGNSRALFKLGQMLSVPQDEFANRCFEQAAEKGVVEAQVIVGAKAANDGAQQERANAWYRKAAENGFAPAQYIVGTHFHNGKGVNQDVQEALSWYRKSARQGFAAAQSQLGLMYARGEGVARDNRQALSWLSRAADQGDAEAQYHLGTMYEQGLGVASDATQAEIWYRQAAEQGDPRAQLNLARLFEIDRPVQAIEMYRQAAAHGSPDAQWALGRIYAEGRGVDPDFELSLGYLLAAARQGGSNALIALAELVERGAPALSAGWYRRAADAGNVDAQYALASRLAMGQGVPADQRESRYWYRLAAEHGMPEAQYAVAQALLDDGRSPEHLQEALAWYRRAAKQGFAPAQTALGGLYVRGEGVPRDKRQAASWWLKAAEQGDVDAQFFLGQLFETGGGATADKHAEQWYRRAIERGDDSRARLALVNLHARKQSAAAENCYREHAALGMASAQHHLAALLQSRAGGEVDRETLSLYLGAAAQGHQPALRALAALCADTPEKLAVVLAQLAGLPPRQPAPTAPVVETSPPASSTVGEERSAFEQSRSAAADGDPKAQWSLGVMYARGDNALDKDMSQAALWYRRSAQAGFPAAQAALALLLATGQGTPQSSKEAAYWWEKAAAQGDAESQYNLALMYEKGQGVPQNYGMAVQWLEKAAVQGIAIAQTRLGLAHATGRLGEPDYVEAYAWFAAAAAAGNEAAQANREYAESLMTAQQIREGRRRGEAVIRKIGQRRSAPAKAIS